MKPSSDPENIALSSVVTAPSCQRTSDDLPTRYVAEALAKGVGVDDVDGASAAALAANLAKRGASEDTFEKYSPVRGRIDAVELEEGGSAPPQSPRPARMEEHSVAGHAARGRTSERAARRRTDAAVMTSVSPGWGGGGGEGSAARRG